MLFISAVLITAVCIAVSYLFLKYHRLPFFKKTVSLPGPKPHPFIGNILFFFWRNSSALLDVILELTEKYPSPMCVFKGNHLFIGMYNGDQIKTIIQNSRSSNKGSIYHLFEPLFGKRGVLTTRSSDWIQSRRIMAPLVNTNMSDFFNIFAKRSLVFVNELKKIENKNEIDLLDDFSKCTLTIAFDTTFGINLDPNKSTQIINAAMRFRETLRYRMQNFILHPSIIFNMTATGRDQRKAIHCIHSNIKEAIQYKTHSLNELGTDKVTDGTSDRKLFDVLKEAFDEKKLTEEQFFDNLTTMISTATDTTATTLNFVIFALANFPEIQDKVYKELSEIYATETIKSAPVKYEDLEHMNYLECVIKETLRLFPTVPFFTRQLSEDFTMGEHILPKDAEVLITLIKLNRDEKHWPNPLVFDPNRFLPENISNRNLTYFFPFSYGRRSCIGIKYAMTSMKVILTHLIRTFIFKVDKSIEIEKIKLCSDITLFSVEPLKVNMERRNKIT